MGVTDQGAREARYAEAIFGTSSLRSLDHAERVAALMALADAEVAAAVSEAQAEMRAKWAADVANVQAVALAQRNDAVAYRAEVERLGEESKTLATQRDQWHDAHDRLREGIRALTDEWDTIPMPHTSDHNATRRIARISGLREAADRLRALLDPSPASTTGEAGVGYLVIDSEGIRREWSATVSSGEADPLEGQGYDLAPHVKADEADAWDEGFEAGVEHASAYTHGDNGPPDPPSNLYRPAPVVTPSAEDGA